MRSPALARLFDERFRRVARQPYLQFIALLRQAEFVVCDSGRSQEECAFLGIPCLIHRAVSEHDTGLDGCRLCCRGFDLDVVDQFLASPLQWRTLPTSASKRGSKQMVAERASLGALSCRTPRAGPRGVLGPARSSSGSCATGNGDVERDRCGSRRPRVEPEPAATSGSRRWSRTQLTPRGSRADSRQDLRLRKLKCSRIDRNAPRPLELAGSLAARNAA